jgi:4-hydroxy-tetrahydrodipicolinate reductase
MTSSGTGSSIDLIVNGAAGRMGARVCALSAGDARFTLVAALEPSGSSAIGRDAVPGLAHERAVKISDRAPNSRGGVVIDFSSPVGVLSAIALANERGAALVTGTTGLAQDVVARLKEASMSVPVLLAPNMSLGVAVLAHAAAVVARALGAGYACSIVEAHHAQKKDAPSGTALRLASAVRSAGGALGEDQVLAVRGGDVIGEHTIRFAGPGEYLELTHRATNRDLFALGALRAAAWMAGRAPGWYSIEDALGIAAQS